MHAVLQLRRLGLGPSNSFGGTRDRGRCRRHVGDCPASGQEVPAPVELTPYRLEPPVTWPIELAPLRGGPETMLLVHERVDSVEDRVLSHGARIAPGPRRSAAPKVSPRAAHRGWADRSLSGPRTCPARAVARPAQVAFASGAKLPSTAAVLLALLLRRRHVAALDVEAPAPVTA